MLVCIWKNEHGVQRSTGEPKYMVVWLWTMWTHAPDCVFIATITSCTPENTHDLQTQEISDVMHAPRSFLALHVVIYKATSSYFIWARPDMKPSMWWLCKYFQCSSHNGHCELCEDKRPHLCHGICKGKGCSQVGVRAFVETTLEKGVEDREHLARLSAPCCFHSPGSGLRLLSCGPISSWSRRGDFKELNAAVSNLATPQS